MIYRGHVSSSSDGNCVICKKRSCTFITFAQKSIEDIEIKICVCREHEDIVRTKKFDIEMESKIQSIRRLTNLFREIKL